jgi:hypothetical protein
MSLCKKENPQASEPAERQADDQPALRTFIENCKGRVSTIETVKASVFHGAINPISVLHLGLLQWTVRGGVPSSAGSAGKFGNLFKNLSTLRIAMSSQSRKTSSPYQGSTTDVPLTKTAEKSSSIMAASP